MYGIMCNILVKGSKCDSIVVVLELFLVYGVNWCPLKGYVRMFDEMSYI